MLKGDDSERKGAAGLVTSSMEEMQASIRQALTLVGDVEQLKALSELRMEVDTTLFQSVDPYGERYAAMVMEMYRRLATRQSYSPSECETTNALDGLPDEAQPIPYRFGDSTLVGEYLSAYGWILTNLAVKAGDSVLEYGSGEGQLLVNLARLGCHAHAVDIEARFLDLVKKHAKAVGVDVQTHVGQFGEGFDGQQFDRIYFFEAFHHCFAHQEAIARIRGKLKPDGFLLFSGEPILPITYPDRSIVPYPWGLRLDGESVRSISEFGWMELGFAQEYFVELMLRNGFSVRSIPCPSAWRGHCYIAKPFAGQFPVLDDVLIEANGLDCGWYQAEASHRWTNGDACLPLPKLMTYGSATVDVHNLMPGPMEVSISAGGKSRQVTVNSNGRVSITVDIGEDARLLSIRTPASVPAEINPSSTDTRVLGIAVTGISFAA